MVNGNVNVYTSYNNGKGNERLRDVAMGVSNVVEKSYRDGHLHCRFTRQTSMVVNGHTFDLADPNGLFLLLSRGPATDQSIVYHDRQKAVSARSVQLAETGAVAANKGIFLFLLFRSLDSFVYCFVLSLLLLLNRKFGQGPRRSDGDGLALCRLSRNPLCPLLPPHLGRQTINGQRLVVCGECAVYH